MADADWRALLHSEAALTCGGVGMDGQAPFRVGSGVMIASDASQTSGGGPQLVKDTVVAVEGRRLYISRRLDRNAWQRNGATVAAAHALLTAIGEREPPTHARQTPAARAPPSDPSSPPLA